jgi:phosphodiesterase/alkaline phosphatase D-like protein
MNSHLPLSIPVSRETRLSPVAATVRILAALTLTAFQLSTAAELHLGSGAMAGEITDRSALIHVRLTTSTGQNAEGLIPGSAGDVRLFHDTTGTFAHPTITPWQSARASEDHAVKFALTGLQSAQRHYYRFEIRADAQSPAKMSETFSFLTAPRPGDRAAVMFHLTTCQDLLAERTYLPMIEQKPDFCVSDGDTVYYDGQCLARDIPQAWQAYQKMFGLPAMKDYYRNVGGYFMKDDHDFRFNDSDPYMKGVWARKDRLKPGARVIAERGEQRLDGAWLTAEEGARVFQQVFPIGPKPYRTFRWGRGVQLWLLENREFRSPNDMEDGPNKSIWGAEQKKWLKDTLVASDADFRIIISPNPIIGPDRMMKGDNHANLNGFWFEGQAFLDWLRDNKLSNVVLMCGDRHWQYHSIDRRRDREINEFSCGPTSDDHTQPVPPAIDGVDRPYAASRGGFMKITYATERTLAFEHFSMDGAPLYRHVLSVKTGN